MTREEAKVIFINRGFVEADGGSIYDPDKWRESVKVISDWLEQPCDAISRQVVLEFLKGFEILHNHDELRSNLIYGIMSLPSVTPQPKTGHWITKRTIMHDGEFYCDVCDNDAPFNKTFLFCPNCGAKMVEPQESEAQDADSN